MIDLGNPDHAFQTCFLPTDGIGLARFEFITVAFYPRLLVRPSDFKTNKYASLFDGFSIDSTI